MLSYVVTHLDVIVATLWALKELWVSKESTKRKLLESARALDAAAHELELLNATKQMEKALLEISEQADSIPEFVDSARKRLDEAERLLIKRRSPEFAAKMAAKKEATR